MVVDGDGQDLLGAVLIDDVFIEILLDDMRLVLREDLIELAGEVVLFLLLRLCLVHINIMIDFADAVLADGKARRRIVDRHIVFVVDRDHALAETAAMLRGFGIVFHIKTSFL